jgi:hypothetical protein
VASGTGAHPRGGPDLGSTVPMADGSFPPAGPPRTCTPTTAAGVVPTTRLPTRWWRVRGAPERSRESGRPPPAAGWFRRDLETDRETEAEMEMYLASDGPGRKRARCTTVFLTCEIKSGFFTYHGFLTITSLSRIISLDMIAMVSYRSTQSTNSHMN